MLELAVKARLPLVTVHTTDALNLKSVLHATLGHKVPVWDEKTFKENSVYYVDLTNKALKVSGEELFEGLVKAHSTLILVNPKVPVPSSFDAGALAVPKSLLVGFLGTITETLEEAEVLSSILGGCTLKESAEMARMTMVRDKALTPPGLMKTRRLLFRGGNGLFPVDTEEEFYEPPQELVTWAETEAPFFLNEEDFRLVPRGMLFGGPPGTGKTSGAKWIARTLKVPLFRVDIGSTKGKYVGQSEAQLTAHLASIDNEAPCVVLFDEIEKIFSNQAHDTSGTTTTMLSMLLWWLAERTSRIFVVMTTNNADAIPPELYREGRLDQYLVFSDMEKSAAERAAEGILKSFSLDTAKIEDLVDEVLKSVAASNDDQDKTGKYNPAKIRTHAIRKVKQLKNNLLSDTAQA